MFLWYTWQAKATIHTKTVNFYNGNLAPCKFFKIFSMIYDFNILRLRSGGMDKTQYNMKYYWRQLIKTFSNTSSMHKRSFKSSNRVKRTVMGIWTNSSGSDAGAAHNLQKYPWEVLIFMRLRQV